MKVLLNFIYSFQKLIHVGTKIMKVNESYKNRMETPMEYSKKDIILNLNIRHLIINTELGRGIQNL